MCQGKHSEWYLLYNKNTVGQWFRTFTLTQVDKSSNPHPATMFNMNEKSNIEIKENTSSCTISVSMSQ